MRLPGSKALIGNAERTTFLSRMPVVCLDKALSREVLIAYQMNGRDLPEDHGWPHFSLLRFKGYLLAVAVVFIDLAEKSRK
jgi:hypothetical protein